MSAPEPVLLTMSITTGLAAIFGGLTLVAGLGDNPMIATVSGIGLLVVAGVNQGLAYYVRGQVVPTAQVVEQATSTGQVVAGPANELPTGERIRSLGSH